MIEDDVAGVVLDQQDLDRVRCSSTSCGDSSVGRVKWNVAPGRDVGVEPDPAAVVLDDLAAHREADAGALVGAAGVQALEDDEDPVGVLGLDPDAVVRAQ